MRKKRRHKLENRAELRRLRARIENELQEQNPNWDLVDATLARIKVVFRHAQFSDVEDKNSHAKWINATQTGHKERREQAEQVQWLHLRSFLSSLECSVKGLRDSRPLNQTSTSQAWKDVRPVRHFLMHTHFASAADKQKGLERMHKLINEIKKYEREQLKNPDRFRLLYMHQIFDVAGEAHPPRLKELRTLGCNQNLEAFVCNSEMFNSAKATLGTYQEKLQHCSKQSRKAWEIYMLNRVLMLSRHKAEIFEVLVGLQKQLHRAWEIWLRQWQMLYAARLKELVSSTTITNELVALEYDYLGAQLARRHAHKLELEEKLESWQDLRYKDDVQAWLIDENQRIARLHVKIRTLRLAITAKAKRGA